MTSSNYQINLVDLDSTYIPGNDPNYVGIQLAVTNRKTVIFGQQLLTQTYPIGNINNAINYSQTIPTTIIDQDSTTITGVGPTSVFYKARQTGQSLIRANFALAENYPQTNDWLVGLTSRSTPVQVGTSSNWVSVGAGFYSTGAIQKPNNSSLWTWGANSFGQLGVNTTLNYSSPVQVIANYGNWSQIVTAYSHTLAIQSNGTLWAWGSNAFGQLGNNTSGSPTNQSYATQIGSLSTWIQASASNNVTFALQSNGTLWACGYNTQGQLGTNNTSNLSNLTQIPGVWRQVSCGYQYTVAIQSNGTLWAWGQNNVGQLGQGNTTNRSSPVQIGVVSTWSTVSAGTFQVAAIQSNGTLFTWGGGFLGQLGINSQTNVSNPIQVGSSSTWTQVSCGYSTMAVQTPGTLWAWGANSFGQLGQGNQTHYSSPVQVGALSTWTKISSGIYCSTGILSNGTLYTWGRNINGELGLNPSGIPVNKLTYGL